jgi:alpha-methylacyl-CoA racemase
VYRCRDDRFVSVGCIEGKFYAEWVDRLRRAGGDSKLCDQLAEEQLNVDRWIEFKVAVGNIYLTKTRDEWTEVFAGSEACCAPVYDASELKATGNKYLGYPNRPFLING